MEWWDSWSGKHVWDESLANLSLIPRTHLVKAENWLHQVVFSFPYMHYRTCTSTHTHTLKKLNLFHMYMCYKWIDMKRRSDSALAIIPQELSIFLLVIWGSPIQLDEISSKSQTSTCFCLLQTEIITWDIYKLMPMNLPFVLSLLWVLGIKLRSPCLEGKHFTNWAISPAS